MVVEWHQFHADKKWGKWVFLKEQITWNWQTQQGWTSTQTMYSKKRACNEPLLPSVRDKYIFIPSLSTKKDCLLFFFISFPCPVLCIIYFGGAYQELWSYYEWGAKTIYFDLGFGLFRVVEWKMTSKSVVSTINTRDYQGNQKFVAYYKIEQKSCVIYTRTNC